MRTVALGDGLQVSAMGFGGMALSQVYGGTSQVEALQTLNRALELGITFLDTADVYGEPRPGTTGPAGTNEELFGMLLRDRRSEVQIATKFGITGQVGAGSANQTRGDREYVRNACEASLRRLGVDTIDLYYLHRRDLSLPIEETVAAMAELVREGKVRHLGLSEVTADELRAAATVHPIAAVQSEWSLWSRDVEASVVPTAAALGVGFVPYSPLGRGFLTGSLTPERISAGMLKEQPRFSTHFDANQAVLLLISRVASELGASNAQVALAWLYAQGARMGLPVAPIPGTRNVERLAENAAAMDLSLSPSQLAELDAAAGLAKGDRNLTFNGPEWISSGRE